MKEAEIRIAQLRTLMAIAKDETLAAEIRKRIDKLMIEALVELAEDELGAIVVTEHPA